MADSYVICFPLSSSRVAGMVNEALLASASCWELHNFETIQVAAVLEESFELDFASLWGCCGRSPFGDPTIDNELARLRNITVFCINEIR